jgi:hypothetical protein
MSPHEMPYERCPSYDRCSCNACALDPEWRDHPTHPLDTEKACRAHRPTRLRIVAELRAEGNPHVERLQFGGLTPREENRRKRAEAFAALPQDERERVCARLRPASYTRSQGAKNAQNRALHDSQGKVDLPPASQKTAAGDGG